MFLTFCICDFFFLDSDPEFALFIIWILYSTTIKIFSQSSGPSSVYQYAPHTLDIIAAHATYNSDDNDPTTVATGTSCVISSIKEHTDCESHQIIINKFCGTTIGATAATCGIKVAYQVFMNSRIPVVSSNNIVKSMKYRIHISNILDDFFKWAFSYKKFRYFYSNLIGKLINTVYGIEKVLETPILEYCIKTYDSFVKELSMKFNRRS